MTEPLAWFRNFLMSTPAYDPHRLRLPAPRPSQEDLWQFTLNNRPSCLICLFLTLPQACFASPPPSTHLFPVHFLLLSASGTCEYPFIDSARNFEVSTTCLKQDFS
ncbi:hypothetical protein PtB15_8B753 [Puccinia triticina]|nr:hypothetical protein PtB15_8B753 [Puccinia triticina]